MHKWDSDDDDECADIQSSASKSETQQSFDQDSKANTSLRRQEQLPFDGYGMNTEEDYDRYTGTFAKGEVNHTVDHGRTSNLSGKKSANKSSFLSINKAHNKPAPQTVTKTNRANVRNSVKQTFK